MSGTEMEASESTSTATPKVETFIQDGKNKSKIYCIHCNSLILRPQMAEFQEKEFFLPNMKTKPGANPEDGETLCNFWFISDMFTFENLGFTNTLNNIKYLTCADCEIGPIGIHDITQKNRFYLALDRVKHGD